MDIKSYAGLGVTQKIMADIAGLNPPTINKIVSAGSYVPLDSNISRNIKYSIDDTRDIIKKAIHKNKFVKHKKISFYNFKGGVGKTTLCYQVASHLAIMGFNVLAIDADPQGHLSTSLGLNTENNLLTLHDIIVGELPINEAIVKVFPGLDCLPANIALSRLEPALNELPKREERISIALKKIEDQYDYIIFDSNPTISHINRNIITCSDLICVVVETQAYALNGLKLLLNDLQKFCKSSLIEIPNIVVVPNKYEERTAASGEAMAVLKNYYSDYIIPDFAVRKSEELHTSGKISQPLALFCRSNSIALEDIRDVVKYLLNYTFDENSAAADSVVKG